VSAGAHIIGRTGRAPSGRLRNFGAMRPEKFWDVYDDVFHENNDLEAKARLTIWALKPENANHPYRVRNFQPLQPQGAVALLQEFGSKPDDVDQDIWDTLKMLAGEDV
jgi:hypothetical protein